MTHHKPSNPKKISTVPARTIAPKISSIPRHPAVEFLMAMDGDPTATFNIEHYTDLPKGEEKPKPEPATGALSESQHH